MHHNLFIPEAWESLNDSLRSQLNVPKDQTAKIYRGLGHALYETALGASQFFSHKRSVGFVKGNSPFFDFLMPHYLREAYQVQTVVPSVLTKTPPNWSEWAQSLKKDTVFVMACEDHPITGELLDLEELDGILNERRIFFLRVSHTKHFFHKIEPKPYSVRICSLTPDWAFVLMGSKFKIPSVLAHVMNWSKSEARQAVQQSAKEEPDLIRKFEDELEEFSFPWSGLPRLYDRSLLVFPEVSGDLMTRTLNEVLRSPQSTDSSFTNHDLWTTNLCHWESLKLLKSWWSESPSENTLRDLLILSPSLCVRKNLADLIRKTYNKLKASQGWKF